jgi:hypothetical protein
MAAALAIGSVTHTLAADPHSAGITSQPSQSCQSVFPPPQPLTPPEFDTQEFANAESHYAGSQPQNSRTPKSVAQYDVACVHNTAH